MSDDLPQQIGDMKESGEASQEQKQCFLGLDSTVGGWVATALVYGPGNLGHPFSKELCVVMTIRS